MSKKHLLSTCLGIFFIINNIYSQSKPSEIVANCFSTAEKQYKRLVENSTNISQFPRTINEDGSIRTTDISDWTQGFFPGGLWYIYEYTKNPKWRTDATKWTEALEKAKFLTNHHDIGFVMYCSYGNALRFQNDTAKINAYNKILIQSAESALTRFDPKVGLIKSWNPKMSWNGKTMWQYPVIIDNMMNLEMLYYVSKLTGNPKYKNAAMSHALNTMKNHFRKDHSTYHVVDYNPKTGAVAHKQTSQGYSDNSTWSRGQAWAIYGFTMMYRETKDKRFLETAKKAADFFINHPNLPEDKIPYWDFNAGQKGYKADWNHSGKEKANYKFRDASAAAIVASALLELSTYTGNEGKKYFNTAETMIKSLSGKKYLAEPGTNSGFILKHSVGSIPHNTEIDVPLVYADYYFLESLLRYKKLKKI